MARAQHLLLRFGLGLTLLGWIAWNVLPVSSQTENLLANPGFEENYAVYDGLASVQVAAGWTPFWITENLDTPDKRDGTRPAYMPSSAPESPVNRARSGARSQLWHTKLSTAFAGVYQNVAVPEGATVRLSAWSYAWSSNGNDINVSSNPAWVRQRVGIDPTGGTDPLADWIVWSLPAQYLDTWGEISVEATAQGEEITVFLSAYPNFLQPQNDIYFDDASLTLVSYSLPTPGPVVGQPVAAPTVDPLLVGLITGQGVAGGNQGIQVETHQPIEQPAGPTPWRDWAAAGFVALIGLGGLLLWYPPDRKAETKQQEP